MTVCSLLSFIYSRLPSICATTLSSYPSFMVKVNSMRLNDPIDHQAPARAQKPGRVRKKHPLSPVPAYLVARPLSGSTELIDSSDLTTHSMPFSLDNLLFDQETTLKPYHGQDPASIWSYRHLHVNPPRPSRYSPPVPMRRSWDLLDRPSGSLIEEDPRGACRRQQWSKI